MRAGERGAVARHGERIADMDFASSSNAALVCECERVSVAEVKYAIESLDVTRLNDLRRRTRIGMGTCQGHMCAMRAAGILAEKTGDDEEAIRDVARFVEERWRGVRPVAWGDSLVEAQFTQWFYDGICGLDDFVKETK